MSRKNLFTFDHLRQIAQSKPGYNAGRIKWELKKIIKNCIDENRQNKDR